MTENQKMKRNFRNSKAWKEFKHKKNVEQKGKDPITEKKLYKGADCHHMRLDPEFYTDLTDPSEYVLVNQKTHDALHWAYSYYKSDKGFLKRFKHYLDRMIEINEGNDDRSDK